MRNDDTERATAGVTGPATQQGVVEDAVLLEPVVSELSEAKPKRRAQRREERPGLLMERDLEVLVQVYKFRYMSPSQVQALLFPSRQTTLRRLRYLTDNGYLSRFRVPGIEEFLFCLEKKGAEVVAEKLLVPVSELLWSAKTKAPRDPWFMRHFLLTGWFRIRLMDELEGIPGIKLLGFIPEYIGEAQEGGGVKKYLRDVVTDQASSQRSKITHTPDAVFALGRKGEKTASAPDRLEASKEGALFFLEIDRGTEAIANPEKGVLKTLRYYLSLMGSDHYQRYARDFEVPPFQGFRVLFLTTTRERIENIRTVGGKFPWTPEKAKRFIWLAPREVLEKGEVLGRVWRSFDPGDETLYGLK